MQTLKVQKRHKHYLPVQQQVTQALSDHAASRSVCEVVVVVVALDMI